MHGVFRHETHFIEIQCIKDNPSVDKQLLEGQSSSFGVWSEMTLETRYIIVIEGRASLWLLIANELLNAFEEDCKVQAFADDTCDRTCGNGNRTRIVECSLDREAIDPSLCDADKKPVEYESCTLGPCEEVKWAVSEWSGCEDSCSPSLQSRQVHCTKKKGAVFPDDSCDAAKMPEVTKACQKPAQCNAMWHASEWSEVSNPSLDTQKRELRC
ncbi:Papilin [Araneus ventricosus]|uniref:Papilin n=1 Tax=Araneus ventricosus TaxID=182803 RepID=A0A4Y2TCE8_ARAVE|nr:Papilin [Araneus ventricosus]